MAKLIMKAPWASEEPKCELLGAFAILIQCLMGIMAVMSLVIKRQFENPQRPWWVWFYDVSKQIIGAACLHLINVLVSMLFSSSDVPDMDDNPCNWYFMNILMDTTVGIPVLWFFLYLAHRVAHQLGIKDIVSGEYGNPPKWSAFYKQATIYIVGMFWMKVTLGVIMWVFGSVLDDIGQLLISWTNFDARVQVGFVMMVFPLIMNSLQYYLVDTIIQSPVYHHSEPLLGETADEEGGAEYGEHERQYGSMARGHDDSSK